jgi:hypothetical protein
MPVGLPGHMSSKSYLKYDRSKEAKVRAAQRCAAEPGLTYAQALREETMVLAELMVNGDLEDVKRNLSVEFDEVELNPPKKLKGSQSASKSGGWSLCKKDLPFGLLSLCLYVRSIRPVVGAD